jgi:hypothetical protein
VHLHLHHPEVGRFKDTHTGNTVQQVSLTTAWVPWQTLQAQLSLAEPP